MSRFDLHVGIDYSGRGTPLSRTPALQVYASFDDEAPRRILSPASKPNKVANWNRQEVWQWLIDQARKDITFIVGIDHGFSFPLAYFRRYELKSWLEFLDDFSEHWPTDQPTHSVETIRAGLGGSAERTGSNSELRLTETWSSSAKSVFLFDVQGSVAKSTHAGLPWIRRLRSEVGHKIHFWPFDGWEVPDDKCVIAETYPAIFKNRYPRENRKPDQHDAYAICRWLTEADQRRILHHYFTPPLTSNEQRIAALEGWILGIA